MAKSSPEKLAQALKANLKRRKQAKQASRPEPAGESADRPRPKPPKTEQ